MPYQILAVVLEITYDLHDVTFSGRDWRHRRRGSFTKRLVFRVGRLFCLFVMMTPCCSLFLSFSLFGRCWLDDGKVCDVRRMYTRRANDAKILYMLASFHVAAAAAGQQQRAHTRAILWFTHTVQFRDELRWQMSS